MTAIFAVPCVPTGGVDTPPHSHRRITKLSCLDAWDFMTNPPVRTDLHRLVPFYKASSNEICSLSLRECKPMALRLARDRNNCSRREVRCRSRSQRIMSISRLPWLPGQQDSEFHVRRVGLYTVFRRLIPFRCGVVSHKKENRASR